MGTQLFADPLAVNAAQERARQVRSLPISMALHAALVSAAVTISAALPHRADPTPETVIRRLVLPSTPGGSRGGGAPLVRAARPRRPQPPRPALAFLAPNPALPLAPIQQPAVETLPTVAGPTGDCLTGCGTGPGSGTGTGTGDGSGPGSGTVELPDPDPVRVSSLNSPTKVREVRPAYPPLARQARVEGRVVLDCTLSAAGEVVDVRVLSGHPLLTPAAVAAVRQWRYTSTLLNGVAVPALLTVVVDFRLAS